MSTSVKVPANIPPAAPAVAAAASAPTAAAAPPAADAQGSNNVSYRLPDKVTLENAVKWAIIEDRPIMMDYWADSLEKKVMIGVRENQEKLLVKNPEEYTSPIAKIFKHNQDYIVMTENSIYLVDATIPIRRIS
jgi:hypothetical protein